MGGQSIGRHRQFKYIETMNEKAAVTVLTALAHEARLRIFRSLMGAGPAGLTPSALAAMLDLAGSTLSFHLKELAHADLVTVGRDGRQLFYRPSLTHMNNLLAYLVDHCCQGGSCALQRPVARPRHRSAQA
jgi:DNA-binding transcriptional ArsR family regulator